MAAIALPLLATFGISTAQDTGGDLQQADTPAPAATPDPQTVRRLLAIRNSLQDKRVQAQDLIEALETADELARPELRTQIIALQQDIRELSESFETTALDGLKLRSMAGSESQRLDWRDELMQIAEPILQTLKSATDRPRRMSELQQTIEIYRRQLDLAKQAAASLQRFSAVELPPEVADGLSEVSRGWLARNAEISRLLGDAEEELRYLESTEPHLLQDVGGAAYDFILGRGTTLLLALIAGLVLWYTMRRLRHAFGNLRADRGEDSQGANTRLLQYAWHLFGVVLVALAILSVFYLRGDVLLLSLALVALVMLALGVWRYLPGYVREARLLLNAGSARAGERVIYNGLPLRIESLNLYSELANPELEGSLRLPLGVLGGLNSRPAGNESWFPCRCGDYLLMPDGMLAKVLRQTVERVEVEIMGSTVQYGSTEFLQLGARNLSREGYGVVVVFGIDYRHQAEALDRVPDTLRAGLETAFAQSQFADDLQSLVVDFKSAGQSSLDYLVYASMAGSSAASYFKIGRLIQQACVATCNRENWIIPFAQVTIHRSDEDLAGPASSNPAGASREPLSTGEAADT